MKFGAYFCSFETKTIFLSEYSPNPRIFILDYDLKLLNTIENVCELEISQLHFENNSNNLFIFCGCPEYTLKIFNVEKMELILLEENVGTEKI